MVGRGAGFLRGLGLFTSWRVDAEGANHLANQAREVGEVLLPVGEIREIATPGHVDMLMAWLDHHGGRGNDKGERVRRRIGLHDPQLDRDVISCPTKRNGNRP